MSVKKSIGNLSLEEQESFRTFVQLCTDQGLLQRPDSLPERDLIVGLHDEATLLYGGPICYKLLFHDLIPSRRFLRGRAFDAHAAFDQFKSALHIRQSAGAIAIYDSVDVEEFEHARHMVNSLSLLQRRWIREPSLVLIYFAQYPHWSGARDKSGNPLCVFDLAGLDLRKYNANRNIWGSLDEARTLDATRTAVVFNDYLTRLVLPICSTALDGRQSETASASAVYLVDASSLTLGHAWNLRYFAQDFSQLLATCYPEVVERIYVSILRRIACCHRCGPELN